MADNSYTDIMEKNHNGNPLAMIMPDRMEIYS